MKKHILIFTLLVSSVYGLSLDDLISYKNEVQIVNRRVNEVRYEFKLIEKISDTSGVFEVLRYDKIREDREDESYKRRHRYIRNGFINRRNGQQYYQNKIRERKEDRFLEKDSKRINNVTQSNIKRHIIYIEDVNVKNSAMDDIFTFEGKHLYKLDIYEWRQVIYSGRRNIPGTRKTMIHKFTILKEKAKKFIRNNK